MIKYSLRCRYNHFFEGWFRNSDDYDSQKEANLLTCPFCHDEKISKAPMAPSIHVKKNNEKNKPRAKISKNNKDDNINDDDTIHFSNNFNYKTHKKILSLIKETLEKNYENVGSDFAKKVREIFYKEAPKKNIYGTATVKETKELLDEGIDIYQLPDDIFPVKDPKKLN